MAGRRRPWYDELFRSGDYVRFWLGGEDTPLIPPESTERQVAFVREALALPAGAAILDLCCGHGRHAIPLAQAGYRVTGLDLAARHLQMAREAAKKAGVSVDWLRADMRRIPDELGGRFDAVINMATAFGYLESDAEDQKVLDGVGRALKPGGRFLIDFINREATIRRFLAKDWEERGDAVVLHSRRLDFQTGRNQDDITIIERDGSRRTTGTAARVYTLAELIAMMGRAGLRFRRAWGDFEGGELSLDSRRLIVLAEKEGR